MKKHILMLALMVMGVASYVCAGEPTDVVKVNPVKHGNMIRGHGTDCRDGEGHSYR